MLIDDLPLRCRSEREKDPGAPLPKLDFIAIKIGCISLYPSEPENMLNEKTPTLSGSYISKSRRSSVRMSKLDEKFTGKSNAYRRVAEAYAQHVVDFHHG